MAFTICFCDENCASDPALPLGQPTSQASIPPIARALIHLLLIYSFIRTPIRSRLPLLEPADNPELHLATTLTRFGRRTTPSVGLDPRTSQRINLAYLPIRLHAIAIRPSLQRSTLIQIPPEIRGPSFPFPARPSQKPSFAYTQYK